MYFSSYPALSSRIRTDQARKAERLFPQTYKATLYFTIPVCGAATRAAPRFGMSLKFYIRWFEYQDLGFSMREANQQWEL